MNNQTLQEKYQLMSESQLFLNQNEYIKFGSNLPKQMSALLQLIDKGNQQINPQTLYQQIQGNKDFWQKPIQYKYLCQGTAIIIQTIKSITVFAGQHFIPWKSLEYFYKEQFDFNFDLFQHITFSNLKKLNISYCFFNNMQALSWLNMKGIKEIDLQNNNISSLKPFKRTSFDQLTYLGLDYNPYQFNQLTYLQRSYLPELKLMKIDQKRDWMPHQYIHDVRILVKLQDNESKRTDNKILVIFFNSIHRYFNNTKAEIQISKHSFLKFDEHNEY